MAKRRTGRSRPSVALLIETSTAYGRGLLSGVLAYMRENIRWRVYVPELRRGDALTATTRNWRGDGVIARIENSAVARTIEDWDIPAIDVSAARLLPDIPVVETDDRAIAELAFDHLYCRGFRRVAFCGVKKYGWSVGRRDGFLNRAEKEGCEWYVYECTGRCAWEDELSKLKNWIQSIPRTVGILASYDQQGRDLLEACQALNLNVPEDVAILGVDNDEMLCELAEPPMSSVMPNARQIGYQAARLLDCSMAGKQVPGETRIEPRGIVTRQSTDILAIEDSDVAAAARFIRHHACEGIKVADILAAVPLSRRVLETRFLKYVGRSPHEEILRIQLGRVKDLLLETDLNIEQIAQRTGFRHVEYLSVVFKRELGSTPSSFRQEYT